MKRKPTKSPLPTLEQIDLSVAFYDLKVDFPHYTFEQAAKRLLPKGFGTGKNAVVLKREARRNFDLATE